ncbi:MAG: DUF2254 domain-containing protein [Myxococcales bacterium]|nr:DUF2254 domain-containing protein [Myxococcales bacterium]MCB9691774.1 DUF2254 domain-containing protein [Alphaproteobacteria bacterium]
MSDRASLYQAFLALVVISAVSLGLYAVFFFIDFGLTTTPWALWAEHEAASTLTSFSEVTVAVLGIAITVVAIIVELAANRYTPRITDLFVNDTVNQTVMSFFVVTTVFIVLTNMSLYGGHHPVWMVWASTALMTSSLLGILPYFVYVFDFLTPTQVVRSLTDSTTGAIEGAALGKPIDRCREEVLLGIEQLGDITLNSIDKKDQPIAISTVDALASVARCAIANKRRSPEAWFDSRVLVKTDQDFVALHEDMVLALQERRTWVEMKVLRQYQTVFGAATNKMRDINHLIGIQTRRLALEAYQAGDQPSSTQAIRFMNTYLRAALNTRDVRTAYNLMNEYRVLAEEFLDERAFDKVIELARHIRFYGQLAFSMNTGFILETAAYDLCALIERVHTRDATCHERLLVTVFLELDREPEGSKTQEASLRGVRKAQIKLATHYLVAGDEEHARLIYRDMRGERRERIASIRAELEAVTDQEYWEVSDRGINFEWLPPERRAMLPQFFSWFDPPRNAVE